METCADCGKPIKLHEASYYRKDPAGDFGRTYHSSCGDPFGIKAKDAEIARLRAGYEAIKKATTEGRVCDDVAWFDTITTLYDFCDEMLCHEQKEDKNADRS